jgi:hypothetical protein
MVRYLYPLSLESNAVAISEQRRKGYLGFSERCSMNTLLGRCGLPMHWDLAVKALQTWIYKLYELIY